MTDPSIKRFKSRDAELVIEAGTSSKFKAMRKTGFVLMSQQKDDFEVETEGGLMQGHAGDFLAVDPVLGHAWPVTNEYVRVHYEVVK